MNTTKIAQALSMINERTQKGSKNFYKRLPDDLSEVIRAYYREQLPYINPNLDELSLTGSTTTIFTNPSGTHIATGYKRIVIGDYGAYIEFDPSQMNHQAIKPRWPGTPNRPVKYLWLQSDDSSKTKIYHQKNTVSYADYRPELYYVSPIELRWSN